ncbi:FtsK/SpoIIIE family DNA translocase [Desulfitibacter alkalitolerans]|uniref:FtsK/SpoIIIE family DNA translocase n=1 Tax=Desulfitibacter alkalitolerans TaxID=264641 RepID=UPI0004897C63|nr:DNA translocase FtsK [Desulfitibacter alkalitolerans]
MQIWERIKEESRNEVMAILWLAFAALSGISIYIMDKGVAFTSNYLIGFFGLFISRIFTGLVGQAKYLVPLLMVIYAVMLFRNKKVSSMSNQGFGIVLAFITITTALHINIAHNYVSIKDFFLDSMGGIGGGVVGATFSILIMTVFGIFGSYIVIFTCLVLSFMLITNTHLLGLLSTIIGLFKNCFIKLGNGVSQFLFDEEDTSKTNIQLKKNNKKVKPKIVPVVHMYNESKEEIKPENYENDKTEHVSLEEDIINANYEDVSDRIPGLYNNAASEFTLPPISLLQRNIKLKNPRMNKDISEKVKQLEDTLSSFGVNGKVSQVSCGPAITRFEIQPETGTKVSKIVNLSDDIALNLAASQVRIEAPIPGKAAVGIEVPNKEVAVVGFRDVLESPEFLENPSKVTVGLGMDIAGKVVVADLSKMPHLLVAGATGSGKSVCMNSIICSLLYKALPTELKLLIIDPKMVELTNFNGIPHLIAPVVTDSKKAATALRWMVNEMENRYEMFAAAGVKDITRFNNLKAQQDPDGQSPALPYIVILIDELADLMMVAPADVEDAICRLAQMARAAGIHLVVATQRPSVDVITGLIKANIPSRIAFAVSSQIDSRTILDMGGAEKLLGQGDMLYFPIGASKPIRVQGAYVSDKEVEKIVKFLKVQGAPEYENVLEEKGTPKKQLELDDELLPEATRILLESNQASISLLQRRLRIGYTRAARLIDIMEEKGIVGGYEGSKPRAVLIDWEEYKDMFKKF